MEQPLEGRLWLPPDCETGRKLLLKLHGFHSENARAVCRGQEHIQKHENQAAQVSAAITMFDAIDPHSLNE